MRLYRTSVKEDLNVSVVFQHLAENYVNKVGTTSVTSSRHDSCSVLSGQQDRVAARGTVQMWLFKTTDYFERPPPPPGPGCVRPGRDAVNL